MYDAKLQGVHFPQSGQVILTTTTPKKYRFCVEADERFDGLTLLPFLTTENTTFALAKELVQEHIKSSMDKRASWRSSDADETFNPYRPIQCDMILFISVLPVPGVSRDSLVLYESEMRFPTGQTTVKPPAMEISGVMYSPDCGAALEWRDERAVKVEKFWHAGRVVAIAAGLISGVQVWWVLREMGERGSPSVFQVLTILMVERE